MCAFTRPYICIEVKTDTVNVFHIEKNWRGAFKSVGQGSYPLIASMPDKALTVTDMPPLNLPGKNVRRRPKINAMISSSRTVLRIEEVPGLTSHEFHQNARIFYRRYFPLGEHFDEEDYIFSGEVMTNTVGETVLFLAALPNVLAESITDITVSLGMAPDNIMQIDILERWLIQFYGGETDEPFWLCLPQENGLRFISVWGKLPRYAFSISNDPIYRQAELSRFWHMYSDTPVPRNVLLIAADAKDEYSWIAPALSARDVPVEYKHVPDFNKYLSRISKTMMFNFLPLWVAARKRRRRLFMCMMVIEVLIFSICLSIAVNVRWKIKVLNKQVNDLDIKLKMEIYLEPDRIAAAAEETETALDEWNLIKQSLPLSMFDANWLDTVDETVPGGVTITGIDIQNHVVNITAETTELRLMGIHRESIVMSKVFSEILFGPVLRLEDGRYRYVLIMGVE